MTNKKKLSLECLWEEAKMYSTLYYGTKDKYKKQKYISHFRSPIFDETNTNEKDLIGEAQNIMGKLSGTNLDPVNLMKNMNLDLIKMGDIFNKK